MNNLYEALEICLKEIEQGSDIDTVLFRYPDLANELRPILETSVRAKALAVPAPSQDVLRRNRAKLLQRAAEMREGKAKPVSMRVWSVPLRRAFVTLMVVAVLFVSGTGLVRAASATVPGDNLYPVKRTWEDVLLLLAFDMQKREALELEHENERLEELYELFAEGRSAKVDFAGYVTRQSGTEWRVSGIRVILSPQTRIPEGQVVPGAAVRVRGRTDGAGIVIAERIELLPPGAKLPEVEDDEFESDEDNNDGSNQQTEDDSGGVSESEETETPDPEQETIEGVVSAIGNNTLVVNGILMDISLAGEIVGSPRVGAVVKVEGYYDANGVFIVTKIEFKDGDSNSGGSGSNDDSSNDDDNNADNSNDDDGNDDDGNDDNDNGDDQGGDGDSGGGDGNDNNEDNDND